jgi:transcriptional regulator with XRE-family HTH domain
VAREDPERLVRNVGRRIAQIRLGLGISQERLAERLNCSVQWVSRVEAGENLTIHTLARVANVLRVRVVELFEPPQPEPKKPRGRGRPRKADK